MHPVYRLFATINSLAPTILRLLLTTVYVAHATQKILGWYGGDGLAATLAKYTRADGLGLPYSVAVAGLCAELGGALLMFFGFCTRLAALLLLGVSTLSITLLYARSGFFVTTGGYEYAMTLGGIALALLCSGGGRFSIDRRLSRTLLPPNDGVLGAYKLRTNL
jgi:putative oxidoreductase